MIDFGRLPKASGPLLELIENRRPAPAPPRRSLRERVLARSQAAESAGGSYAGTALRDELDALSRSSQGTRNHALNRAAFNLFQLVDAGRLDEAEVIDGLATIASQIGLSGQEIQRTLGSARGGATQRPRDTSRLPDQPPSGVATYPQTEKHHPESANVEPEPDHPFLVKLRAKTYDIEQVKTLPDPEPLIAGRLMRDSLAVLWGAPASKKSFTALDIGLHVTTGNWWHGAPVTKGRVVVFVGEGAAGIKSRLVAWQEHHNMHGTHDGWHLVAQPFNLLDPVQQHFALQHCAELTPDLVIIDTLARHTVGADENSAKDWSRAIETLDEIREVTNGAAVLVVHHTNAEGSKMRGHTSLLGAVDTSIRAVSDERTTKLEWWKTKDSAKPADMTLYNKEVGPSLVLVDRYVGCDEPDETAIRKIMAHLCMVARVGFTTEELSRDVNIDVLTLKRHLNTLIERDYVERKSSAWFPLKIRDDRGEPWQEEDECSPF